MAAIPPIRSFAVGVSQLPTYFGGANKPVRLLPDQEDSSTSYIHSPDKLSSAHNCSAPRSGQHAVSAFKMASRAITAAEVVDLPSPERRLPPHSAVRTQLLTIIRYLTDVESRLARVEGLFNQLLPEISIDEALAQQTSDAQPCVAPSSAKGTSPDSAPQIDISEAVPDEADGFDWHENVHEIVDGMASLSVEPRGAGYLGMLGTFSSSA